MPRSTAEPRAGDPARACRLPESARARRVEYPWSQTRGLPAQVLEHFAHEQRIRIPMRAGNRSLNLSNAVAVIVYEAWRQNGFDGCLGVG